MATDAAILTARNEYHAAIVALNDAKQRLIVANATQLQAARKVEELQVRVKEVERHLLQVAAQKPAEPAPVSPKSEPTRNWVPVPDQTGQKGVVVVTPPNAGTVPSLQPQPKKHKVGA